MATAAAARTAFRSAATRSFRLPGKAKTPSTASSPFTTSSQKPLSPRIFRSPVEMSCCSMLPYHTATASSLLISKLSVAPRAYGWTIQDCNDDA